MATYTLTASQLQGAGILNIFDVPDIDAQAYLTATGIADTLQQNIIAELVRDLKNYGLWSKMKAVYPFVTDQRNLASFSEDFSNAVWQKTNGTITANSTIAPNGTTTADTFTPNTTNSLDHLIATFSVPSTSNTVTQSIYVKANGYNFVMIEGFDTVRNPKIMFNLTNGTSTVINSSGSNVGTITNEGNGWYRISMNWTTAAGLSISTYISSYPTSLYQSYAGNGTSGVFIWGAQVEGTALTAYQPQLGSAQAAIASQFKYNLVNPVDSDAAFRLIFNGGWTHSANGATPNGTNGFANTYLVPSSVLSLNSTHISCYTRTNTTVSAPLLSSEDATTYNNGLFIWPKYSGNLYSVRINDNSSDSATAVANTQGLHLATRTASNVKKYRHNTTQIFANTTASTSLNTSSIYVGASRNNANYSTHQTAFASIGDGLTDTEAANLYTAVQAFQTKLSRQV